MRGDPTMTLSINDLLSPNQQDKMVKEFLKEKIEFSLERRN